MHHEAMLCPVHPGDFCRSPTFKERPAPATGSRLQQQAGSCASHAAHWAAQPTLTTGRTSSLANPQHTRLPDLTTFVAGHL